MTAKKKITDSNGVQVFPITHTKAVLDDNGNSVEQRLQENLDLINQKQLEVGAVPSDLTPTAGSTNWVTSGGVFDATERLQIVDTVASIDKNSCVVNYAINADGTIKTTSVGTEYYISNFIEIPESANRIVYTGVRNYSANINYGCLYDSNKSMLLRFQGDGVIDLSDYPLASLIVIGIRTTDASDSPNVAIQDVSTPYDAAVIDTREDSVVFSQDLCTTEGIINGRTGMVESATSDYHVSDYIDISQYDHLHYSLWNAQTGANFAGGCLYDESYRPITILAGDGVIELSDKVKYVVIGTHVRHKRVSVEVWEGNKTAVKALSERIPQIEEELMYDSGSGIQNAGNVDSTVNNNPASNNYAIGVVDSAAEQDGTITSVSFNAYNTGTIHFMLGVWDETHEYFDIRATHDYSVASTGNQTLTVSMPILKGETLMVNISTGVRIKYKNYSGNFPAGSKNSIVSVDGGVIYHPYSLRTYLSWNIQWSYAQTVKEKVAENATDIAVVEEECERINQQVSELASSRLLIQGDDGKVYRLVVTDGVLGIENTTPQNILILAHSFACILTGVWQRGMTSSKKETDWVSQMDTVFLPTTVNRVSMIPWEQAFPNPSSQLSMLDSYLNSNIDAIFIMCGANVAAAYRTQQYGQDNYAALVNYCKAGAENADIYVCSPGYTPETDGFNIGIKAGAESAGATYISTYSTQGDKLANFGDVVLDASENTYSFVVNSSGRVNHPNDIWHLFMANNILSSLGYNTLDKYRRISYNASVDYRGYARWVAGGHCTVCTFDNSEPTVSIVDSNNNAVSCEIMDLSGVTWVNTPPRTPTWAIHFDMPDSDVTITIS